MVGIEVSGSERLLEALDDLGLTLKDFRSVWVAASREFYDIERELFDSEGATGEAGAWAPLTRAYAKWKAKRAPGKPILELTGQLKRSLTRPNAKFSTRRVTAEEMIVGTTDPKAVFHYRGTRKMVARPPVSLTAQQEKRLIKVLREGLLQEFRRSKFIVLEVG